MYADIIPANFYQVKFGIQISILRLKAAFHSADWHNHLEREFLLPVKGKRKSRPFIWPAFCQDKRSSLLCEESRLWMILRAVLIVIHGF